MARKFAIQHDFYVKAQQVSVDIIGSDNFGPDAREDSFRIVRQYASGLLTARETMELIACDGMNVSEDAHIVRREYADNALVSEQVWPRNGYAHAEKSGNGAWTLYALVGGVGIEPVAQMDADTLPDDVLAALGQYDRAAEYVA